MKKLLFTLFLSLAISLLAFSQPNHMVSNTATSFTLNWPCGPVSNGTYTVEVNYFDFSIGDWVPGPDHTVYTSYSGVVVTVNSGTGDVVYDFSSASPVPNFPLDMSTSQGWIRVTGTSIQMNWDNHQLNCPALPVTLISFNASKSGCNVTLTFVTADEYDMTQFVIERNSVESGPINMPIKYFTPHNDGLGHTYSFVDSYPFNGHNIYRVKLSGLAGYVKYSNQIMVNATGCTTVHPAVNCSGITINGPATICGSFGDYSISSNPSYTVNNWSWATNDYYATINNTYGPSTRVIKNTWYPDGQVQLMSYRAGCTVGTQYSYKQITLGTGLNSGYYHANYDIVSHTLYRETYGDNHLGQGGNNWIKLENPIGTQTWEEVQQYSQYGTPITWSYPSMGFLAITMPLSGSGWILFKVTISTSCGPVEYYYDFWSNDSYRLTPNPASSEIVISTPGGKAGLLTPGRLRNKKLFDKEIRQVIIIDRAGRTIMHKAYGDQTRQVRLNTSSLKPDFYIARIFNGKTWEVMKFIKK